MEYGVRKMTARIWRVFLLTGRLSFTIIFRYIGPFEVRNDRKTLKKIVFVFDLQGTLRG